MKTNYIYQRMGDHIVEDSNVITFNMGPDTTLFDLMKYTAYLKSKGVEPEDYILSPVDLKSVISNTLNVTLKRNQGQDIFNYYD